MPRVNIQSFGWEITCLFPPSLGGPTACEGERLFVAASSRQRNRPRLSGCFGSLLLLCTQRPPRGKQKSMHRTTSEKSQIFWFVCATCAADSLGGSAAIFGMDGWTLTNSVNQKPSAESFSSLMPVTSDPSHPPFLCHTRAFSLPYHNTISQDHAGDNTGARLWTVAVP